MDEPHDAVKLLLARMDSHPEEFTFKRGGYHDRWYEHINTINAYGNEADITAINTKMRDIRLTEVHEQVMEELLNGPAKRRVEEEEAEYEKQITRKTTVLSVGSVFSDMNPIKHLTGAK